MTDKENRLAEMVARQFAELTATGGSGGGGGSGDNPFIPPTGYKQVGVVAGYPVPRVNLRSACVNDLGFPFALGIDDDTVQAGDKILVVGQATDDGTPYAVWGTVDSTRTAGNYYIARLTVEGSAIRTDAAYVVDITANGGTLVFGATKVNVNVPNPSSGSLAITENGTYDVTAKASAVVNVENSYTASDEGKVVDNGALVSQTSQNINANGTYDTTTKNEVVVNVPSSGGGVDEKWRALYDNNTVRGSIDITDNDLPSGFVLIDFAFYYSNKLRSFSSQMITKVSQYAFYQNSSLTTVNLPNVTKVNNSGFSGCTALQSATFDKLSTIETQGFFGCSSLVSISGPFKSIKSQGFSSCSSLTSVHITQSDSVCTLTSGAFNGTPIWGDGAGYIYVPDALVEDYKVANNWSTYASHIKGESEMDGGSERDIQDIDDIPEITEP